MVRGRYRVGVSKTKTKEKIMMKKKVMPLSCLMAAAMLAGCGTAAPAVPEETTAPAVETAEAAQETAPADAAESEAAAVEKTAGVWQVEPCYNFDEIVPLYSEWDHTAGKNAADGLYAVRDGERWSLFSTKTCNIMMQDAAQQMPYLYGTNELSVWLDDEYYNYDNFAAMREKCEGLNAELQANGAEIEVLYDGVGGYANRWIYTEDGQIYYDLLGTYEFSGTPLVQVNDASALFGVRPATWDNEYRCYTVANGAPYAVARSDGSLLSSFRYKNVCMAGDELIAVEDTDGNWGYCDINGEEVIPCTYQAAMQAEGASEPIDYPFPDMSGVVVVQDFINFACVNYVWLYAFIRFETVSDDIYLCLAKRNFFRTLLRFFVIHVLFQIKNGRFANASFPVVISCIIRKKLIKNIASILDGSHSVFDIVFVHLISLSK